MAPPLTNIKTMAMPDSSSEDSYAKNSSFQNRIFHVVGKPLLEKAVEQLVRRMATRSVESTCGRKHIGIADFGCSYGRNTLDCAQVVLGALERSWAQGTTIRSSSATDKLPEIQYFFVDLPSNDFNSLFQSLHPYLHHPPHSNEAAAPLSGDGEMPKIYAAGVPGSFHGCLLPSASLDLAICTYSLHWLSQVPPNVLDKSSSAWNGGQPWIHNAPQAAVDAYTLQSQIDMNNFLKSRAQELASGGVLFFLVASTLNVSMNGTIEPDQAPRWEVFKCAWEELVKEGAITMEEFETFNMPAYSYNEHQLRDILKCVPEFKIIHMETVKENDNKVEMSLDQYVDFFISGAKSTVETHLNKEKTEKLCRKFREVASRYHNLRVAQKIIVASLQRL